VDASKTGGPTDNLALLALFVLVDSSLAGAVWVQVVGEKNLPA